MTSKTIDINTFTKTDILTLMKCCICRYEKLQFSINKEDKTEREIIADQFPKLENILRGLEQ